jgi:hypothetical protein
VESVLHAIVQAAEETHIELVWPAWVFPLIAAIVFIFLGFVMHSFRDVANRHSHKTDATASSGHTTDH